MRAAVWAPRPGPGAPARSVARAAHVCAPRATRPEAVDAAAAGDRCPCAREPVLRAERARWARLHRPERGCWPGRVRVTADRDPASVSAAAKHHSESRAWAKVPGEPAVRLQTRAAARTSAGEAVEMLVRH